jgi:ubiquinol oxidase
MAEAENVGQQAHNEFIEHEELNEKLKDPALRAEYAKAYDGYRPGVAARVLGWIFVKSGDLMYGKRPSYAKFKAIEVIARIPYQSWEVASYTLLTFLYSNERRAIELAKTSTFSRMAQDNETLHVVVISQIVKRLRCAGWFRHTLIPLLFAAGYALTVFVLYLISRRAALELNYVFESHANAQYQEFLDTYGEELKLRPVMSEFLDFYGRKARNELELFESIRNDELIHRNRSIRELQAHAG